VGAGDEGDDEAGEDSGVEKIVTHNFIEDALTLTLSRRERG
jgi:hypothetical protein